MYKTTKHSNALMFKEKGNAFFERGSYQIAIHWYLKGIELMPLPELWFNLGFANEKLDRDAEAFRSYQKALLMRPDYLKAQCGIERIRSKGGHVLIEAKAGDARYGALFRPTIVGRSTPSGETMTVLDFPIPSYLYLNGTKTPLRQVEEILGKRFCNTLTIDRKDFVAYRQYCHQDTALQVFATQLASPDPLPADFFDIRRMGKFGYGLFVREPVKAGTILTYYLGKIIPMQSFSDYSLGFGHQVRESSASLMVDLTPEIFTLGGLMQHLPDEGDLSDETIRFPAGCEVATENIHRYSVHLVAEKGPLCGVIVTPLVAQHDLKPGEIIGFSYKREYWDSRSLMALLAGSEPIRPVYFDQSGKVVEPISRPDIPSVRPKMQPYSDDVLPRAFYGKTFSMLADEAAPHLEGDAKIKAAQAYIERLLGFDRVVLEMQRGCSIKP